MATLNSVVEEQAVGSRPSTKARESHAPSGIAVIATIFQAMMLAAHWFVYETWRLFWGPVDVVAGRLLVASVVVLSFSFLAMTLLAFRYNNFVIRTFYRIAAVWLGTLNFLFLAAILSWLVYGFVLATALNVPSRGIAIATFGAAAAVSAWGVLNANWVRVRKIAVKLENLPEAWRGRTAVLASDLHLGHVRHRAFSARVVRKIASLRPDIVFLAGDLFDGTHVKAADVTWPWKYLRARFGAYFVMGNHELFRGDSEFVNAVQSVGIRVLQNEKVEAEGLQIIGVAYNHATHAEHFRSVLAKTAIDSTRASILLTHAPDRPAITEEAGIGLQLSGHTHLGQFFPFTWITRRIYRQFTYGLSRLGGTQFYTSSGAGTWGPPLRVGSQAEIVQITFE
jgi:predicted MPP superfamily phosphohydrolase